MNKPSELQQPVETAPQLPDGCGYEGHDFGASYPDSKCYGGRLYDLDNCDGHGNLYEPAEYIPCPECNHDEWREQFREDIEIEGYVAAEAGKQRTDCPYPKPGLRYPQDGEWLKECWLRGFDEFHSNESKFEEMSGDRTTNSEG